MKRLSAVFLFLLLLSFSCTKSKKDIHFYGRVTLDCNHQMPIKNCRVEIYRVYDDGQMGSEIIGGALTDHNGYYSFFTDVKQKGKFYWYGFNFNTDYGNEANSSRQFSGYEKTKDNDDDIEVNCNVVNDKAYKFHIKNVSPVNSGGVFISLIVSKLDNYSYPTSELLHTSNLVGINVDTTIYQFYFNTPKIDYKYSYIKNGVLTAVPPDTLPIPNCLDTTTINIFY